MTDRVVILSEAKDHLAVIERRKKILRFAQDDTHLKAAWQERDEWLARVGAIASVP